MVPRGGDLTTYNMLNSLTIIYRLEFLHKELLTGVQVSGDAL
jgi:hypothetical protein